MDLFSLFRGTSQSDAAAPASPKTDQKEPVNKPLQGGDPSTLETRGTASNDPPLGTPNQPATPAKTEGESSPLAEFEKLWQNINTGKGNMPSLNADPAKISEAAKRIDFTKGIDPALAQKALAGDVNAFMAVLNGIAQNSFTVGTQASTHLVDKHTSAVAEQMRSELPGQFKNFQASDSLMTENPRLANPAVSPLISVIQQQLAAQFPQATSAQLREYAVKYLSGVVEAISPEGTRKAAKSEAATGLRKQQQLQAADQFEWDKWAAAEQTSQN